MNYRTFTTEDQIAFAELSGDYNPIHVDAVAARRSLFGSPVVHGIHALLWGLDCCLAGGAACLELHSIRGAFLKPIKVGEEVRLMLMSESEGRLRINLLVGDTIVIKMEVELRKSEQRYVEGVEDSFPKRLPPRDLSDDEIAADSGALDLCLKLEAATRMFPNLVGRLSLASIAVLLGTTRLVGVLCPGLNSLYCEVDLSATLPSEFKTMNYEVTSFDRRLSFVLMKVVAPGLSGLIKAFRRPTPQVQADYLTLKRHVRSDEFSDQRALVVGGSRGLGEVAAKLLAGGGAEVKITYHQGREDAARVVGDIISNGGSANSFRFDVLKPEIDPEDVAVNAWAPTHLYYFATPFISPGVKGKFSARLFHRFCEYYVDGLMNTVNQFSEIGLRQIFYPSTVFIDELPATMGEYAAAKVASEMLCSFLEETNRDIIIHKPRLPKMATDQTVTLMAVTNRDPAPIMINELRSFRDSLIRN